jgi:hypothetical protein
LARDSFELPRRYKCPETAGLFPHGAQTGVIRLLPWFDLASGSSSPAMKSLSVSQEHFWCHQPCCRFCCVLSSTPPTAHPKCD